MKNFTRKIWSSVLSAVVFLALGTSVALAQTTISGTVTDADTKETLVGVNILVKGKVIGTNLRGEQLEQKLAQLF